MCVTYTCTDFVGLCTRLLEIIVYVFGLWESVESPVADHDFTESFSNIYKLSLDAADECVTDTFLNDNYGISIYLINSYWWCYNC